MRVHVIHAHPVESSFNRSLYEAVLEALDAKNHEVDALDLYADGFDPVLSREERLNYHEVPGNLSPSVKPYVDRLRAADAMVFVHPVWNYGYPAILKGYFDRIYLPGVTFEMDEGGDRGQLKPVLNNITKVAFVTTYGGGWFRTMVMGDPPRRLARRWAWATFRNAKPPTYLALYDMNNVDTERLEKFTGRVRREIGRF